MGYHGRPGRPTTVWGILVVAALAAAPVRAGDLQVVELFTSQGCSSCPPADRLLGELIKTYPDLLGLEFHVDYWDDLNYGIRGSWQDPFSQPGYTERQRRYHHRGLAGRRGVYTPQAVIDGRYALVGSDRGGLTTALRARASGPRIAIDVARQTPDQLQISLTGAGSEPAEVWLVGYDRKRVTVVAAGENHGRTLTNHNVVRTLTRIAEWRGSPVTVTVPHGVTSDQGCAVLVQRTGQGPIVGAARC